jgi:hypothetical protein
MNDKKMPPALTMSQFIFEVPLYAEHLIDARVAAEFYGRKQLTVDGHCPYCGREATFNVDPASKGGGVQLQTLVDVDDISITCTRDEKHKVRCWFYLNSMVVQKIGQFPSLADIANDEVKIYRKLMPRDMAAEFHKAVGLAAHGVGVGSFVYLRRVFERLIKNRFDEFKGAEGSDEAAFRQSRMEDKIAMLKGHLPEFLVQNRKIYSILSLGIHELSEQACLGYFDVMRHSIIMILEDDRKAREVRERREVFTRAIAGFKPPTTDEVGHS